MGVGGERMKGVHNPGMRQRSKKTSEKGFEW